MDLRKPSGLYFLIVGVILLALGVFAPDKKAPLLTTNLNLIMGVCLVVFGGIFLWLSRRT
jgi:hypothetical protein